MADLEAPARVDARWWQRLFGRQPKQNAFAELIELVTVGGAKALSEEVVEETCRRYRLSEGDRVRGLEDLYATLVRRALGDRQLTQAEQEDLEFIRGAFRISSSAARRILLDLARGIYAAEFVGAITNDTLPPASRERLERLAADLQLPQSVVDSVRGEEVGKLVQRVLNRFTEDRRLSPEEDEHLQAIARDFGVTLTQDVATLSTLERFRLLWRIEHGELPTWETRIHLQRGEVCHAYLNSATLLEPRVVTRSVGYHGPHVRIRIAKGLYWNAGRVFLSPERREEWKELDSGTLYITNKRLIFDGGTKSSNLLWRRVIDFQVFQDGLKIEKDSGRDQLYRAPSGDMEIVGAVVAAARERATG